MSTDILAKKNMFASIQGSKREIRFFGGIRPLVGKSRLRQNTGIQMPIDFLAGKSTFALVQGFNYKCRYFGAKHREKNFYRLFGGKKYHGTNKGVQIQIRIFGRKKSTLSKHWDINFYGVFGRKKFVCTNTEVQMLEMTFCWEKVDFI